MSITILIAEDLDSIPWNQEGNVHKKYKAFFVHVLNVLAYPLKFVPEKSVLHVLNVLAYPLKFVPEKSVLRMPEYTNYTYRIADVINGLAIELVPKKFSFN